MLSGHPVRPTIPYLAAVLLFLSGNANAQSDDILYGTNKNAQVSEINLTQQTFGVVGNHAVGTAASDQDPETGRVYFFEMSIDGGDGNTLRYWDPDTDTVTIVRVYDPAPDIYVKKMAFAPDNTLYMADDNDILYTVDKETGDMTTLGEVLGMENSMGLTGGDFTFTPDGSLYAVNLDNLYFIDVAALTATTVYSDMLPVPGGASHFTGVGYCNDLLYATGTLFDVPLPRDLSSLTEIGVWTIDPATGVTNQVMQLWPGQPRIMINDISSCVPESDPDVTPPTVTITSPTSQPTFTTESASISLGGTASDDTGVDSVTWSNDRGGSGTASGTENWSVATVSLQSGDNVITVTASDAAGNTSTDVITVTYDAPDVTPPTVTITSPTSQPTFATESASISLGGTASDDTGVTSVTWSNDRGGSGSASGTDNWSVASVSLQTGDNVITVTASDAAGNTSSDVITVSYSPPDVTPPTVAITSPTSQPTFATESASISLGGTASDDTGVDSVTWSNSRGGSGTASGTDNWSVASVSLQSGDNVITVTASDAAGNTSTDTLTVTYTPGDVTPPTVTITSPTSQPTFTTTSSSISLGGNASDDTGVDSVTWSNSRGGSGTASGTDNWSVASVSLQSGDNVITVTASDAAGNTSTDVITVTYDPPDVTPPTVTITSPTSQPTFTTQSASISLGGTASDDTGVDSVTWSNNRGGSGTASGTDNWSVAAVSLQTGDNVITVTASDAAGNTSTDVITVTREVPNQAPTATVTTPADGTTFSIGQTLFYAGTASDPEDGALPASAYTWEAARVGGPFFPLAQGVTSGTSQILQQPGSFIIRLTVQDSGGLSDTDQVTITVQ